MGYEAVITNLRIKLFKGNENSPFYNRFFNMKELVKQLNTKQGKLRGLHYNPIRFMIQHNCSTEDANVKPDDPWEFKGTNLGACASYFSQFAQQDPGFGHILTFVYTDRDFVWNSGNSQNLRMEMTYNKNGKQKSLLKYFIIRNRAKPVIKIPKVIGICSGQHRTIKAIIEFPDPSFSEEQSIQLQWSRVSEENESSIEEIRPISAEIVGEKLGTFLSEKIYHDKLFKFSTFLINRIPFLCCMICVP